MSILNRIGGWLRMERRSTFERPEAWLINGVAPQSASGMVVTSDTAMRVGTVFSCVRVLSETIATLPLHLYRRLPGGGKERATDHPLYSVLHSAPNPLLTTANLHEMRVASMCLRGWSPTRIVRNLRGEVTELIPLSADAIRKVPGRDRRSFRYEGPSGTTLQSGEVWETLGFTLDGFTGVSAITYNRETIGLSMAAERHAARVFDNAARPSGVLQHPGKLSPEARKNLSVAWGDAHSGDNVGRVAVLEEDMEWKPLTMSMEDTQYIETRKLSRSEIAALFRVPPHKVGDLERATFSNIEHQAIEFVQDAIRPLLVKIEQSISRDLLLPSERAEFFAEFNIDGLLRGDYLTRMRGYQIGINSGMFSPNDALAMENMSPRDGGDVYLTPMNMRTNSELDGVGGRDAAS